MLTLSTNVGNFVARLFMLIITLFIEYLFITYGLKDPTNERVLFVIKLIHFEFKVIYLMCLVFAIMGFFAFTIIASLLTISRIQIDTISNTITFSGLLTRKTIVANDISEYFETVKRNTFKTFHGLELKLKDNKTIQVAGQNVRSLSDFKNYLTEKGIRYIGQRKMKFPFN